MKILNWKTNLALNILLLIVGLILILHIVDFIKYSHINIIGAVLIGYAIYGIVINVKKGLRENK